MTTRREYAISLGLAQPGRGRMSREANEAIAQAEAGGMVFDQPADAGPKRPNRHIVTDWKPSPKPVVQKAVQETPTEPSRAFTGRFEVQIPDGKRKALSNRSACTCGASLCYCRCATPTVYRSVVDPTTDDVDSILNIQRV